MLAVGAHVPAVALEANAGVASARAIHPAKTTDRMLTVHPLAAYQ
jgi:hypothetical protein